MPAKLLSLCALLILVGGGCENTEQASSVAGYTWPKDSYLGEQEAGVYSCGGGDISGSITVGGDEDSSPCTIGSVTELPDGWKIMKGTNPTRAYKYWEPNPINQPELIWMNGYWEATSTVAEVTPPDDDLISCNKDGELVIKLRQCDEPIECPKDRFCFIDCGTFLKLMPFKMVEGKKCEDYLDSTRNKSSMNGGGAGYMYTERSGQTSQIYTFYNVTHTEPYGHNLKP